MSSHFMFHSDFPPISILALYCLHVCICTYLCLGTQFTKIELFSTFPLFSFLLMVLTQPVWLRVSHPQHHSHFGLDKPLLGTVLGIVGVWQHAWPLPTRCPEPPPLPPHTNQKTSPEIFKCPWRGKSALFWGRCIEQKSRLCGGTWPFPVSPLLPSPHSQERAEALALRHLSGCNHFAAGIHCWCNSELVLPTGSPRGNSSAGVSFPPSWCGSWLNAGWWLLSFWNSATFPISSPTLAAHPAASPGGAPLPPLQSSTWVLSAFTQVPDHSQASFRCSGTEGDSGGTLVMWASSHPFSPAPALPPMPLHVGTGYPGRSFPPSMPDRTQGTSPSSHLVFPHLSAGVGGGCPITPSLLGIWSQKPIYKDPHH